jgi:hypothetical protein
MLLLVAGTAAAQFSEDALRYSSRGSGVSARSFGMGNAFIGVSDDFSAVVSNPAGLAQMRRLEFTGGIRNFGFNNEAVYLGSPSKDNSGATSLDDLGFVFPFPTVQGSLVFAVGYNRAAEYTSILSFNGYNTQSSIIPTLFDADAAYDIPFKTYLANTDYYTPIQGDVAQSGIIKEGGSVGQWSFAGAIDVAENISFGVTLNLVSGSYDYTRNYVEQDTKNVYANTQAALPADSAYLRFNSFYYDSFLSSDISGGGVTFGAMYRTDALRVGLIAKSPTSVTVKETYKNAGESVFDATGSWAGSGPDTKYSYEATNEYGVSSPWTLGAGASWYPIPELLLSGDVEYTDWTQIEWTDNPSLEESNVTLQSYFRSTTSYRAGVEFDVPKTDVRVRGGYSVSPSPYKGDPSAFDRVVYTAGAGVLLQRNILLDGAIGFGTFKTFRNQYSFPGLIDASRSDETVNTTQVVVTLSYRF